VTATHVIVAAVATVVGAAAGAYLARYRRRRRNRGAGSVRRILLPFTGTAISRRSLDAALRLARAEDATLVPAFLATVPRHLPLDAAVPAQCGVGMPMLEAIEQVAAGAEIPVDARVGRGRTYRHALALLLEAEPVDRVIVPADGDSRAGLSGDDLVWLLERAQAEVLILRASFADDRRVTGDAVDGHF
jgi:hypothetical protein